MIQWRQKQKGGSLFALGHLAPKFNVCDKLVKLGTGLKTSAHDVQLRRYEEMMLCTSVRALEMDSKANAYIKEKMISLFPLRKKICHFFFLFHQTEQHVSNIPQKTGQGKL